MALMARICRSCRLAFAVVGNGKCPSCGEPCGTADLLSAFTEQGAELQKCEDDLAKQKERAA